MALRDTSCLVHLDWGPKENIACAPQAGMQTDFQDRMVFPMWKQMYCGQVIDYNSQFIAACCERSCLACSYSCAKSSVNWRNALQRHSVTSSTHEPTYPSGLFSLIHFECDHYEHICTIVSWPSSPYHWLTASVCIHCLYSWRNLDEKENRGRDSIDNTLSFVPVCSRDKTKLKRFVMSFSLTVLLRYLSKSCNYQAGTDLINRK